MSEDREASVIKLLQDLTKLVDDLQRRVERLEQIPRQQEPEFDLGNACVVGYECRNCGAKVNRLSDNPSRRCPLCQQDGLQ